MVLKLAELRSRAPEQGRIRFGVKTAKAMKVIDTWRFTSQDRAAIEKLAEQYGGEARPWDEPSASYRNQWEVITDANSIAVWLPEDAYTVSNELWAGGGCQRRCDGSLCRVPQEREPIPCLCESSGKDVCTTKSRLQLVLPTVGFGGTWRLETGSVYFAYEAPGMIEMIRALQQTGLQKVNLFLSQRTERTAKGTRHFTVPQFSLSESPEQIMSGGARVRHLAGPATLALDAGDDVVDAEVMDPVWHQSQPLDEVVDAVIVGDEPAEPEGWDKPPPNIKVRKNPNPEGPKWVRSA